MKRIVINVQTYGDFDIPSTDTIMMAPEGYVVGAVAKLARVIANQQIQKHAIRQQQSKN